MTTPTTPSPGPRDDAPVPRPPARGRRLAALVLLLVALAAGVAGVALDRLVLLPMRFGGPPAGGPPWRHGPERGRVPREQALRDRFARELGLSAEQRLRIDSLMDRQLRAVREARSQIQPRLDSVVSQTRREIDAILTPEQRAKAAELARHRPRRDGRGRPPEPR
jgi:Spy/CpxP family protein refolding chaperone